MERSTTLTNSIRKILALQKVIFALKSQFDHKQ